MVQTKKKVLILDLDLRKGKMSEMAHSKHVKGVAHYLSNPSIVVDDLILRDAFGEGLDLIPIGVIAPNPTELLLSRRLDELMDRLRELYDYIIVDNVPIGLVADASVVNRISDLTLFIVRVGKSTGGNCLSWNDCIRNTNSLIWRLFSMVRKKAVAAMVMVTVMDRVMVIRMRKRRRDYLDGRKRNPGNNAIISL